MRRAWTLGTLGSMVVLAGLAAAQAPPPRGVAAIVNGQSIALAELEDAVVNVLRQRFRVQPATEVQRRQIKHDLLGMMIDEVLMQQVLRQYAPPVPQTEIDKQLADLAEGLRENGRTLADYCRETGQTEAQVRANILSVLQWQALARTQVKDEDLLRYYQANKDHFDQVLVHASHIVLRVPAQAGDGERQSARQRLETIRQEVVAGKLDFADAARQYSQHPSAADGGDVGFIPRKFLLEDEELSRVAFTLKPGEVSAVVPAEGGLQIIKVVDRKPGRPSEFAKVKDEVREMYEDELRLRILAEQRKQAKIEVFVP